MSTSTSASAPSSSSLRCLATTYCDSMSCDRLVCIVKKLIETIDDELVKSKDTLLTFTLLRGPVFECIIKMKNEVNRLLSCGKIMENSINQIMVSSNNQHQQQQFGDNVGSGSGNGSTKTMQQYLVYCREAAKYYAFMEHLEWLKLVAFRKLLNAIELKMFDPLNDRVEDADDEIKIGVPHEIRGQIKLWAFFSVQKDLYRWICTRSNVLFKNMNLIETKISKLLRHQIKKQFKVNYTEMLRRNYSDEVWVKFLIQSAKAI